MWETHREEWYEKQDELLWAAGLFEGEGCFTISGTQARAKLNSTDEDVVRRFHSALEFGQVREENGQVKRGHKPQWEWYAGSQAEVLEIIWLLRPHLGERRQARAFELERHILSHWEKRRISRKTRKAS